MSVCHMTCLLFLDSLVLLTCLKRLMHDIESSFVLRLTLVDKTPSASPTRIILVVTGQIIPVVFLQRLVKIIIDESLYKGLLVAGVVELSMHVNLSS